MSHAPFVPGQFVWCRFPYFEAPLAPGDKERIVYVADIRQLAGRNLLTVMSLYTTTRTWDPDLPLPPGIIPVAAPLAEKMKQKPFVTDARRIAFVPVNEDFFPRLRSPGGGAVFEVGKPSHRQVENVLAKLVNRPDLVRVLGPDAPARRR